MRRGPLFRFGCAAALSGLAVVGVIGAPPGLQVRAAEAERARPKRIAPAFTARTANVDSERIRSPAPGSWLAHGRTYGEQRYSPLTQISAANVGQLGLAWSYRTGLDRGHEATPIVVDGVMYATGSWSVAFALDAKTGEEIWRFDPEVPKAKGRDACCDVVNRGVAVWKGRVFLGALDGRLIALDAATGRRLWTVLTVDPGQPYTITGAPRVVKDLVIIGNGGAEFGVRGYFSAYDAATGALCWRFFTVPGKPELGYEHPEVAMAAKTWSPDSTWESGLGGTVWDSFAYDPELDLLYAGVGNGNPYNREIRSPGGGDNLFLASILAVRPETGELVWHYQTTPGESWDYTATQHMILADVRIDGKRRKVLMQAPKNGFFYVLDRATGELLSAEKYVRVSWATHVDLATGRPVERTAADWTQERRYVVPSIEGGHNWHPMAWSPRTRLVYIPTIQRAHTFEPDLGFAHEPGRFNTGEDYGALNAWMEGYAQATRFCSPTNLVAWDPVAQRQVWRVAHTSGAPAGVLATASDLVFQGTGGGQFAAYDARTGDRLFASDVGVGIIAPPISYEVDGEQYVAVVAGLGGAAGLHWQPVDYRNEGRVLAYKLGGGAPMPPVEKRPEARVDAPDIDLSERIVARGRALYGEHCFRCHGLSAESRGPLPDLRFASAEVHDQWDAIVRGGIFADRGMASFGDVLSEEDSHALHTYVVSRARHEPTALERLATWTGTWACIPHGWLAD